MINLQLGDCLDLLREMPEASVDAIVTDPPYGLKFMGKRWDHSVPPVEIWAECLRVLKPGGHLLAFAGTRTQHRMAVNIEDAGFEIRDMIAWVYGSGFPKSLDVSKAIDKAGGSSQVNQAMLLREKREACGMTREQLAHHVGCTLASVRDWEEGRARAKGAPVEHITPSRHYRAKLTNLLGYSADERRLIGVAPDRRGDGTVYGIGHSGEMRGGGNTDAASQWVGWGTALKPSLEPITMARKPLIGTVVANVLAHGTGAINVDASRVATDENLSGGAYAKNGSERTDEWGAHNGFRRNQGLEYTQPLGRWPANLMHDGSDEVLGAFPDAPGQMAKASSSQTTRKNQNTYGAMARGSTGAPPRNDAGSAARFFKECKQEDLSCQDQSQTQSNADVAEQSLFLQSAVASIVQSVAATWQSLAGIVSSECLEHSMIVTASEYAALCATVTTAMTNIASGFSLESLQEKRTQCGSSVRCAATQDPTGTTTITASLSKSDGSAESATFNITPTSMDRGEAASRFRYCAKASKKDRGADNKHPTVKPTDLMRYLCRLVTPPGGVILDPFMGSGSTGKAALLEGFSFMGIEKDPDYFNTAQQRIKMAYAAVIDDALGAA